jgi:hypothetical protein
MGSYFYPVSIVTKDVYRDWVLCEAEEIATVTETGYTV